jgi:signal transduction histidine kinase
MTVLAGLALCTAGSFASPGSTDKRVDLSEEERDWIVHHPTLRVGTTTDSPPFSYLGADGKATGIDIDILEAISERTGLKFEIFPTNSWEALVAQAKQVQLDLVTGASWSLAREKGYVFTEPYSESETVIVGPEANHRFSHVSMLRRARIAMPRKHLTTRELAARLPSANIVLAGTQAECFEMVAKGEVDVAVANLFVTSQYLEEHPGAKLEISGVITEFDFPLRFVMERPNEVLQGILNKGLKRISTQERDDIFSKHLLFELQGARRVGLLHERMKQLLLAAAAVGALLLLWNFSMRKEIRARRVAEAELREANHELQEANQSMEVFSHSLSHDLKGPLRAISGFAEMLKKDCQDKIDSDGQEYLERITVSASRMNNLMDDVVAYNRASRSESSIKTVSLEPLVHQLVSEFPPEQRECFHVASPLPDVQADPTLLGRCVANLLSNAVKFVPSERTPSIDIRAEQIGSFVKLWVEDNGIGIAPEHQERIFKLFERLAADYEGTGVGLAVVAKAMERMSGGFGVDSVPDKGSRFWIRLPCGNREVVPAKSLLQELIAGRN